MTSTTSSARPSGTLITVAPTGAESAKADVPALPVTPEELAAAAAGCEAAGAALIHIHVRDHEHRPTLELSRVREAVAAVRESSSLIVQLSTGGSVHDPLDRRLAVLEAAPDSCSLTCGTVNFGDEVFLNPWPFMVELYRAAQQARVVPEFELFDLGHVASLRRLIDTCGLPHGGTVHCDLVLGVPGAAPGTGATLASLVAALLAQVPEVTSWSATGVGRSALAVMPGALSLGGHLRVGMEDTLTFVPGRPVRSNTELVERAATLATLVGRPPMTPDDARALLGIRPGG
ncbi:MAG: 3-keto-5-aminohexanoate cleavage protein [Kineosporiaceae bacterium]|nr:3-keto-5-aminohexanoate cleavage protein [Kineosporiaceae bacterium]